MVHEGALPDSGNLLLFKSDPVATVFIGSDSKHTREERSTNHPRWEDELSFECVDKHMPIRVKVIDAASSYNEELLAVAWDDWAAALDSPQKGVANKKLYNNKGRNKGSDFWVLLSLSSSTFAGEATSMGPNGVSRVHSSSFSYWYSASHFASFDVSSSTAYTSKHSARGVLSFSYASSNSQFFEARAVHDVRPTSTAGNDAGSPNKTSKPAPAPTATATSASTLPPTRFPTPTPTPTPSQFQDQISFNTTASAPAEPDLCHG